MRLIGETLGVEHACRTPSGSAVAHGGNPQDRTASPRRRYPKVYPLGQAQDKGFSRMYAAIAVERRVSAH